ncbi:CCC motif membrane protein [Salinimicrobium sp. TH3]|uniref:CCC motif membrane protein n=1 Tax=Salinimicrobium sp. TH3 TaxID=2997342 RepID=UPI0022742742|nr:CCC motif membrane protein [Salinimicrobium sp. TH3]MCY2687275.1 CCC motif membrane protein [Salinimicrobium sp. TH3]
MEKPTLPNSTLILIFGILSILTCCCWGIIGLIFGIVALVLAKSAKETYMAAPDTYSGYNNVKTGRILAIIGIVLSAIYLILNIVLVAIYGWDGMQEMMMESMEVYQNQ